MNNYTLVTNEKNVKEFIDWLPDLGDNQCYFLCLLARNKYTEVSIKTIQLAKKVITNKLLLLDVIKRLEIPTGYYKQNIIDKETEIPQEAMSVYIHITPRDLKEATKQTAKECINRVFDYTGKFRPDQIALSSIQNCRAPKSNLDRYYVGFDIDTKDVDISKIDQCLPKYTEYGSEVYRVLETRGGYHILVDPKAAKETMSSKHGSNYKSNWYNVISRTFNVDSSGDQMIPVPGTYQGGFTPKFIL